MCMSFFFFFFSYLSSENIMLMINSYDGAIVCVNVGFVSENILEIYVYICVCVYIYRYIYIDIGR